MITRMNHGSLSYIMFLVISIGLGFSSVTHAQLADVTYWQASTKAGSPKEGSPNEGWDSPPKIVFRKVENRWTGTVYSTDETNDEAPIKDIEISDQKLKFQVPEFQITYEGTFNENQTKLTGVWKQVIYPFEGGEVILSMNIDFNQIDVLDLSPLNEVWLGTLEVVNAELELGLVISRSKDGDTTAKLDSYTQGVKGIPMDISRMGSRYEVKNPSLGITYTADRSKDEPTLSGTFKQGGGEFLLEMKLSTEASKEGTHRPQTPKSPLPMNLKTSNSPTLSTG